MSRIFDSLQRSEVERTGVEFSDMVSVATQVFDDPGQEQAASSAVDFPTQETAIMPGSRYVFLSEPESLAAEKFRLLGVRMRQIQQSRPLKRVLVTSTIAEEGKSMVAANLAGVLARRKKQKVLLIEGDLRRPVLAHNFGLGNLNGLTEWLQSDSQVLSNIYHLKEPGLWLMPAGVPPLNPLELMQSGRLSALMTQLTNLFEWIIVDSPPLLPLADTTVWARLTDGALLVVREGTTEKESLRRALEILMKVDLLGVVLNACTNANHHNYYRRYAPLQDNAKL